MWRNCWIVSLAMLAVSMIGCGGSGQASQEEGGGDGSAQSGATASQDPAGEREGPAAAVFAFLEAVRTGDDEKAASMLTEMARKKTAEMDIEVAPPGSDTARFEIGKVTLLPGDRAQVAATWSDLDANSRRRTDEVVWMLRREPKGWRIGGVAATVFKDKPPLLLNFEDPEEMLRKQQWVQEEMRRRAEQRNLQAQGEEIPKNSIRR